MNTRATLPHLLRVDRTMLEFAAFVAALRQDGRRAGWLEWSPGRAPSVPVSPAAGEAGVLRAVTVDAEQTVVVKPRRGAPVLRDVLREHFRGCSVVLVHTDNDCDIDAPRLEPLERGADQAAWRIFLPDGTTRDLSSGALAAVLRRPRPFA